MPRTKKGKLKKELLQKPIYNYLEKMSTRTTVRAEEALDITPSEITSRELKEQLISISKEMSKH